ncbi:hypothetical protein MKZ38_002935 [Zalerion maritima]|uniref:DUF676 domain-containing protein n=1 Tax=Zalerion maritima TaxID=339359 RepID=A0AAD5RN79_9PEZI|nr:hypothetical protein MKZ38_002935 [Zalerion maritima]
MSTIVASSFSTLPTRSPLCRRRPRLTLFDSWPVYVASARCFSATSAPRTEGDARFKALGREIVNDYAQLREKYAAPKHPIVLAHGLLGFSELKLAGDWLPAVEYWHGIESALSAQGSKVFCASVPPSHSIQTRAEKLAKDMGEVVAGESVNIIAHSMGGLDSRYMISHLKPQLKAANVKIKSLVTVATPHHGSTFSDYMLRTIGPEKLPKIYLAVDKAGLGTEAFEQLTRRYMEEEFNPSTPDDPAVRYFSFGACIDTPTPLSPFRLSHRVIKEEEGPNDGLVSVASSKWGTYKGTLVGVSHLDLINWSNRIKWRFRHWMGMNESFNAIAFYLDIADMLAKEDM